MNYAADSTKQAVQRSFVASFSALFTRLLPCADEGPDTIVHNDADVRQIRFICNIFFSKWLKINNEIFYCQFRLVAKAGRFRS